MTVTQPQLGKDTFQHAVYIMSITVEARITAATVVGLNTELGLVRSNCARVNVVAVMAYHSAVKPLFVRVTVGVWVGYRHLV